MNEWTQGVFCECYDVQNMAHHGTILSPASLPASISASQIHHSLLILLTFHLILKVRSECLVTFILSIRFSILSADSWHCFQSHKLRTHFTSRHLFSSLYICYNGLFAHRCITQTNLWSSSKSGSGLREMNKWAKLWETNGKMMKIQEFQGDGKSAKHSTLRPTSKLYTLCSCAAKLQFHSHCYFAMSPFALWLMYIWAFRLLANSKKRCMVFIGLSENATLKISWFVLQEAIWHEHSFLPLNQWNKVKKMMRSLRVNFSDSKSAHSHCGIFERSIAFSSLVEFTWPQVSKIRQNLSISKL